MSRLLLALAFVFSAGVATADAQWRGRSPGFGFSIRIGGYPGYGGVYPNYGFYYPYTDAYRTGRFRAPDLLDDPFFVEQHRYDSHFPGRRRRSTQIVVPVIPPATPSYGLSPTPATVNPPATGSQNVADLPGQLKAASTRLRRSLSARHDGQAWLEYLAPHRIAQLIDDNQTSQLQKLLTHYDGVVGNRQLGYISALNGFAATRSLLQHYLWQVSQTTEQSEPNADQSQPEPLPLPPRVIEPLPLGR